MKVTEEYRYIRFVSGELLELRDVIDVDNTGTYLRLTTKTAYYLINPAHVLYHQIDVDDKVF